MSANYCNCPNCRTENCPAAETIRKQLCAVGLHPGYHDTTEKAAKAVCEMIANFRRELADPPADVCGLVMRKYGVLGFMEEGEEPRCRLGPLSNPPDDARQTLGCGDGFGLLAKKWEEDSKTQSPSGEYERTLRACAAELRYVLAGNPAPQTTEQIRAAVASHPNGDEANRRKWWADRCDELHEECEALRSAYNDEHSRRLKLQQAFEDQPNAEISRAREGTR